MKERLTMEDIRKMTDEERKERMLESLSEVVRDMARKLAMLKAMAKEENDIAPEEFDKALNREYSRSYSKFEGKSSSELALIGLAEMLAGGADIHELLGD